MMAAYQPTPGVGGHPGLPHGHPTMAPNPGQHMGQPMQMHPGVTGAPHGAQPGAMMGMQPGVNAMGPGSMGPQHPNAQMAMQAQIAQSMQNAQMNQMNAQQMHQAQQQFAQMGMNGQPTFNQQQQQQMLIAARRQQQIMQAANSMNLPPGVSPQHMMQLQAQAQQQPGAILNPHLQAQMQQARQQHLMAQQVQAHAQQHAQQQAQQAQQQQQVQQAQQAQQQQAQQQAQQQQPQHQQTAQQQQAQQQQQQQAQQQQAHAQQQQQAQLQQQAAAQQAQQQQQLQIQQQAQAQQQQIQPHQQQAQQQQQQQQQAQQQQAHAQQQQQQHNLHLQQQLAMQQVNSQQSNHSQANPVGQTSQQNTPNQMRPQSRTANAPEPTAHPQTPQQTGQQVATPVQQATPQAAQPTNQPANLDRILSQQTAFRRAQLQQQRQVSSGVQPVGQPQQTSLVGIYILKLMQFSDQLSSIQTAAGRNIEDWHKFVERHFAPESCLLHSFDSNEALPGKTKVFEVFRDSIARYFWTYFESGAQSVRLHTELARETTYNGGTHLVQCSNAILSVSYPNGVRLDMNGSLRVIFATHSDQIQSLSFQTSNAEEFISRSQVEKVVTDWEPTPSLKSPVMTKGKLPKAQQKKLQEQQERLSMEHFPKSYRGTLGVSSRVQNFLEIGETMSVMADIMTYSQEHNMRSEKAIEALAGQYDLASSGNDVGTPGQMQQQANGMPVGNRTPGMANRQMLPNGMPGFAASPAMSHLNLPMQPNGMNGSPHLGNHPGLQGGMMGNSHTPSPHLSNMAAPPMIPQHSAQGTNSSTASANTSPNATSNNHASNTSNKRRRSTVKHEGDDVPETGGNAKVKPSPRMTKKQRP